MAVTIDTTFQGESANSYADRDFADTYFEPNSKFNPTWAALSDDEKDSRLIIAARAIDQLHFRGGRQTLTQALEFPRYDETFSLSPHSSTEILGVMTEDSREYVKVKQAQCEMIILLNNEQGDDGQASRPVDQVDVYQVVSVKFGNKKSELDSVVGGNIQAIRSLLRDWVKSNTTFDFIK